MDLRDYEERFKGIKEKLRMAESVIEDNMEAKRRKEKMKEAKLM